MNADQDAVLVFTVQHRSVIDKLEAGRAHYQKWSDSAAFTGTLDDPMGLGIGEHTDGRQRSAPSALVNG